MDVAFLLAESGNLTPGHKEERTVTLERSAVTKAKNRKLDKCQHRPGEEGKLAQTEPTPGREEMLET